MKPDKGLLGYSTKFPDIASYGHVQLVEVLGYYIQNESTVPFFDSKSLSAAYGELDLVKPKNLSDILSKMLYRGLIVRYGAGYRLSKAAADKISALSGNIALTTVSDKLQRLPMLVKGTESEFLKEAINCLRVKAWRASIIITWILTINHLQDYVLSTSLSEFNNALSRNTKYSRLTIRTVNDFENMKESDFIEVLRSAGIISNDQRKILDEKLGTRNSCAHPSEIVITESKVTSFLEDLVYNVLTRLEIP